MDTFIRVSSVVACLSQRLCDLCPGGKGMKPSPGGGLGFCEGMGR